MVKRLVELCQRGTDGACRVTHGRKACAQLDHAGGRRERGLGGARTRERVGDLERRANELVEGDALWLGQAHAVLDLSDRPSAQRLGEVFADAGPGAGFAVVGVA